MSVLRPLAHGGTASVTSISGSGPWTITVTAFGNSGAGNGFDLSYGGGGTQVTAPSTGAYTFTTSSHNGSGGSAVAIAHSPFIAVSQIIFQRGTATTTDAGSATSIVINKPTSVVTSDVMIANIALRAGTSNTFPSSTGWTTIATTTTDAPGIRRVASLYRIADSSDSAVSSYTFSWTG